tara:strand:+ start:902 stop:1981 length:1080 start_codon:yes stop_codon:yes gene_type:complete
MKKLLLLLFLLLGTLSYGQTLIAYDNIETWNWYGDWWRFTSTGTYYTYQGFYTNAFVSSNSSAAIYGKGNGSSGIEQDWYSMPNITVLSTHSHIFRFRLGSYRTTSTAAGSGVDATDYVTVQLSTNGGVTYVNEMRITGFSNAYWNYNGAIASKTSNGALTTYGPTAGGDRTSTGDGYSVIELTIPAGVSNIAIDLYCRVNAAGEEWWIDNIELWDITPIELPIELVSFNGKKYDNSNLLYWTTSSEYNNNFFTIERSDDGVNWEIVETVFSNGNSQTEINYTYMDRSFKNEVINYYKLSQTDYDGVSETFNVISIDNREIGKKIDKIINMFGQELEEIMLPGIYYIIYNDGTKEKVIR